MAGDEGDVVERQRDRTVRQRPAVEQERRAGLAEDRRELVHDPVVEADVPVLRALDDVDEVHPIDRRRISARERPRRDDLDRGRRGQARALRQVGRQQAAEAPRGRAGRAQRPGHAGDVVEPRAPSRADIPDREARPLPRRREGQLGHPVIGGHESDRDSEVDRHRQHVAVVVVGVLADQVDPAGRVHDADRRGIRGGQRLAGDQRVPKRVGIAGEDGRLCVRWVWRHALSVSVSRTGGLTDSVARSPTR